MHLYRVIRSCWCSPQNSDFVYPYTDKIEMQVGDLVLDLSVKDSGEFSLFLHPAGIVAFSDQTASAFLEMLKQ